jgi:hypothetical protein
MKQLNFSKINESFKKLNLRFSYISIKSCIYMEQTHTYEYEMFNKIKAPWFDGLYHISNEQCFFASNIYFNMITGYDY